MRGIIRLVVHVKLAIMKLTGRIIVIGCSLVAEPVVPEYIFQLELFIHVPGDIKLSALLLKILSVQAVGGCAEIVASDVAREHAVVVSGR